MSATTPAQAPGRGTEGAAAAMTPETDPGFCRAMTGAGTPVTVYAHGRAALAIMRKNDKTLICTQDPGHEKGHAACDGQGHILARWPRSTVERYWQHGDCEGHDHGPYRGAARRDA